MAAYSHHNLICERNSQLLEQEIGNDMHRYRRNQYRDCDNPFAQTQIAHEQILPARKGSKYRYMDQNVGKRVRTGQSEDPFPKKALKMFTSGNPYQKQSCADRKHSFLPEPIRQNKLFTAKAENPSTVIIPKTKGLGEGIVPFCIFRIISAAIIPMRKLIYI